MLKKLMIGTAVAGLMATSAMANWNGPYAYDGYAYDTGPAVGIGIGPFGFYAGAAPVAPYDGYAYSYAADPYGYAYAPRHLRHHHRMQGHSDMERHRSY